jgi:hypothetical protein
LAIEKDSEIYEGDSAMYFVYNDLILISFCEIPNKGNEKDPEFAKKVRVIVRDATGKYAWDFAMDFSENIYGKFVETWKRMKREEIAEGKVAQQKEQKKNVRAKGQLLKVEENSDKTKEIDLVQELLG